MAFNGAEKEEVAKAAGGLGVSFSRRTPTNRKEIIPKIRFQPLLMIAYAAGGQNENPRLLMLLRQPGCPRAVTSDSDSTRITADFIP